MMQYCRLPRLYLVRNSQPVLTNWHLQVNATWQELGLDGQLTYPTREQALAARLASQQLALPAPQDADMAAAAAAEADAELNAVLDDQDELAEMLENVDMDSGVGVCVCVCALSIWQSFATLDLCLSGLIQQPPSIVMK
jgi:hypothetical protein